MRPPEFTGGNPKRMSRWWCWSARCFNEAAGIHRRKRSRRRGLQDAGHPRFNEAAGIHRRKRTDDYRVRLLTYRLQ